MTKRATFTRGLAAGAGATALAGALVFAAPLGATEDTEAAGAGKHHHEVFLDEQPRLEALFAKLQADKLEFLEAMTAQLAAEKAEAERLAAEHAAAAKAAAEQAAAVRAAATAAPAAKPAAADDDARRWCGDKEGDGEFRGARAEGDHDGWDRHRKRGGWHGARAHHDGWRR